jgi:hypothetical protein
MLFSTNHIISIARLSSGAKKTWEELTCELPVYINQIQEDLVQWFDGAGSFTAYRMMTDGDHCDISINDRVVDECGATYEVRGVSPSEDLTGTHNQYLLIKKYA